MSQEIDQNDLLIHRESRRIIVDDKCNLLNNEQ